MSVLFGIFLKVFLLVFWPAVLAFLPIVIYLIFNPLASYRAETARKIGIFLVSKEFSLRREKKTRVRGAVIIYGICFWLILILYLFNFLQRGRFEIDPFNILSTVSIVLFCFAIATYLPFAYYLILKNPLRYAEEGKIFHRMFFAYGAGIFVFSCIYVLNWLRSRAIFLEFNETFFSILTVIFSSAALAYLPILFYVFVLLANPFKQKKVRASVIFIIYSTCFLIFSFLYIHGWLAERNLAGIL